MPRRHRETWLLAPPAPHITPALAKRWLHRVYPKLHEFSVLGYFDDYPLGGRKAEHEQLRSALRAIAADTGRIARACGAVLGTGKPIAMRTRALHAATGDKPRALRRLRLLARYERRRPHRGVRGVLQRALRERAREEQIPDPWAEVQP